MKTSEIVYSPQIVAKIRETDPQLKALTNQWEQAFGQQVKAEMIDGRLVIKPKNENKSIS